MDFVHLHYHNQFSLRDALGTSTEMVKRAKKLGHKAIALTNHGNISGLIEHYYACKEGGIKPILGVEAYFLPSLMGREKEKRYFHLILLVKNAIGYKNLMRIVSEANKNGFYYRPRIDFNMLDEYGEGLICTSACQSGIIPRLMEKQKYDLAKRINLRFKDIFGEDYYLEVMAHNMAVQHLANTNIIKLSKETKIPIIMTLDSHYINKEDFELHKLFIGARRKFKGREFQGYPDAHLADVNEIWKMWEKYHSDLGSCLKYIKNTNEVADKCNFEINFKNLYPKYDSKQDSNKILQELVIKEIKNRKLNTPTYIKRAKRELEVIQYKNFSDYFLICQDIMKYAKKENIASGFGRGSVAGSLVAYLLGLTLVNPITQGTLFERFLRKDKDLVPDIDIDFEAIKRDKIFEYIKEKFPNRAAQIIAYATWRIKNTINELGRIYNTDEEVKKLLIEKIIEIYGETPEEVELEKLLKNKEIKEIEKITNGMVTNFCKLFGQISHFSAHACGIAITDKPLLNYTAIVRNRDKFVTSYDMNDLEKIGILKLDILGLKTMSVFGIVQNLIKVKFNEKILKDQKIIQMFKKSQTDGIFQFESFGGKAILNKIQPDNFKEIVACNAMNRPAPLKAGVVEKYILGKHGEIDKDSPIYKYCEETYGQVIYQEQVIKICREMAKMDWSDIDILTRDFREKGLEKEIREKFIKGMKKFSDYPKEKAEDIFNKITLYSFNKAHAVAYSIISFYSMWLLKYYPLEFIYALLYKEIIAKKIIRYQILAVQNNILVILPHVNRSAKTSIGEFDGEKVIQLGLENIKGIGTKCAEAIIKNGPYNNEFLVRQRNSKRVLNTTMYEVLFEQGVMEFNKVKFMKRVQKYNASLFASGLKGEKYVR